MSTIRIYKVSEVLGIPSQEVIQLLRKQHGIEVKSASSTIEEIVARQFAERIARERNLDLPGGQLFQQASTSRRTNKKTKKQLAATEPPKSRLGPPRLVKVAKSKNVDGDTEQESTESESLSPAEATTDVAVTKDSSKSTSPIGEHTEPVKPEPRRPRLSRPRLIVEDELPPKQATEPEEKAGELQSVATAPPEEKKAEVQKSTVTLEESTTSEVTVPPKLTPIAPSPVLPQKAEEKKETPEIKQPTVSTQPDIAKPKVFQPRPRKDHLQVPPKLQTQKLLKNPSLLRVRLLHLARLVGWFRLDFDLESKNHENV